MGMPDETATAALTTAASVAAVSVAADPSTGATSGGLPVATILVTGAAATYLGYSVMRKVMDLGVQNPSTLGFWGA